MPAFGICALVVGFVSSVEARQRPPQFLIISSPGQKSIFYVEAPSLQWLALSPDDRPEPPDAQVLIDGVASKCAGPQCTESSNEGLQSPQGLALHVGRDEATLFVSDIGAGNIYAYELASSASWPSSAPVAGMQRKVREGVQGAGWLATDSEGNLFYTVADGRIEMLRATDLAGKGQPVVLYESPGAAAVSSPAGLATDGVRLFWANEAGGPAAGTVVAGLAQPGGSPRALAANGVGASGLCLAKGNVFYASDKLSLFAVKVAGGSVAEVTGGFQEPRGCTYDGESTLYVADAAAGALFSLPAPERLRPIRHLTKVANVPAPSQVVVFLSSGQLLRGPALGSANRASILSQAVFVTVMLSWWVG